MYVGGKCGFLIRSGIKQGCGKIMGEHGIKWRTRTFVSLDYGDDLSILDESVSKINELSEVWRVQGARICLEINFMNSKSLSLGISEDEKVTLGNE